MKPRKVTVQTKKGAKTKSGKVYTCPVLKISGKFLEANGFPEGRICEVSIEWGKIVIT